METKQNLKSRLKEIKEIVLYMDFSEDNFLDIKSYLKEAEYLTRQINQDQWTNSCLSNLIQTQEKQLTQMEENYGKEEEREKYFEDLKQNFLDDLHICCND